MTRFSNNTSRKARKRVTRPTANGRKYALEPLEDRRLLAVLLADSFEQGEWNGTWVEDSQNDWSVSSQRAFDGSYAAEVDGRARNATLTMANPLDLASYGSAELTYSWYIERSWDSGEYIALDLFDGSSWNEVAALRGNVDQENVWHSETVTIDGDYLVSDFKSRFRAKVSNRREDGFVDNVKIEGTLAGPPEISISDATATEGGSTWGFVEEFVPGDGSIPEGPWDIAVGPDDDFYASTSLGTSSRIVRIDGVTGEVDADFIALGTAGLNKAREIEIRDNWIYVANKGTNEVLRFDLITGVPDPGGAFVSSGDNGLTTPRGVVFDAAGDLYVGSKGTDEILKYSGTDGTFLGVFASNVTGGGNGPHELAFDAAGDLYVSGNDRVYKFAGATGTSLGEFASGGLTLATSLEFGPDGDLYVGNGPAGQILQFDGQTGAFIAVVADPASGNLQGLAFDDAGSLYIANHNLQGGGILRYAPDSSAYFTVSLSSPSGSPVAVDFNTANVTATAGSDYTTTSGTLLFEPGVTTRAIVVATLDDTDVEGDETFTVTLSNPAGTTIVSGTGLGTIVDDEVANYIVDDSVDDMFEYEADGTAVENYNLGSGNNSPRGVAADVTGNTVLAIDNVDLLLDADAEHASIGSYVPDLSVWPTTSGDRPYSGTRRLEVDQAIDDLEVDSLTEGLIKALVEI